VQCLQTSHQTCTWAWLPTSSQASSWRSSKKQHSYPNLKPPHIQCSIVCLRHFLLPCWPLLSLLTCYFQAADFLSGVGLGMVAD
jgi:hypothetical protein